MQREHHTHGDVSAWSSAQHCTDQLLDRVEASRCPRSTTAPWQNPQSHSSLQICQGAWQIMKRLSILSTKTNSFYKKTISSKSIS